MHVCHLITGLGVGGTPVMLTKLVHALTGEIRFTVIGMTADRSCASSIEAAGVPVHTLNMRRGRPTPKALWKLGSLLRNDPPDLLQTWLYHADLMGLVAARAAARCPVVWNVRHATLTPGLDSRSTLWAARACARLSHRGPDAIVVNSRTGRDVHCAAGYAPHRMHVIPNGFDLNLFRPSDEDRRAIRGELQLDPRTPLIGLMARYSSLKGQPVFIDAMRQLHARMPQAHFLLCGTDITPANQALAELVNATGCPANFHLLGERRDIARWQAALDLAVNASTSEAFSNSIGEALASGVPVVTTDVGDSKVLVGDAGRTVPVNDAPAMAAACLDILSLSEDQQQDLRARARQHMADHYELGVVARRYRDLWESVIAVRAHRRRVA